MLIATILGARPQFVKAAAVSRELTRRGGICEHLIHTGQHFDANMSQQFFDELGLPVPSENLGIHGGAQANQIGRMLVSLEQSLKALRPDVALVYGDTNSTVAGALAAAALGIPVAHVEAGLRSFNRCMPEETNRVVTDHLADLLFAPTPTAMRNLQHEGIDSARCHLAGDVMCDAYLLFREQARRHPSNIPAMPADPAGCVLATIHRAENTDNPSRLLNIFEALEEVGQQNTVIIPLHPRTRGALERLDWHAAHVHVIPPVGFLDMLRLQQLARLIVTDSGGMQKEAFFAGVPCAVLRDETEWVELVDSGWNDLVPPTDSSVLSTRLLSLLKAERPRPAATHLFGDGRAAVAIVDRIVSRCSHSPRAA